MKTMTSRERMLAAIRNREPDRVPVAPDISNMIPCRLTGKPFWEIYRDQNPPLWRAYLQALDHFKMDGWFIYGALDFKTESRVESRRRVISKSAEAIVEETIEITPDGEMRSEMVYDRANPPAFRERPVKDLKKDFAKVRHRYPKILGYERKMLDAMRAELGDRGVLGLCNGYPGLHSWVAIMQGGLEDLIGVYYDERGLIEEWRTIEERYFERLMEMELDAKPDFILLGGSGSITLQSPAIFRELSLPTIRKLTRMARQAGVPTMLHSCGKERALVEMCAEETALDCVNPLEVPPMGDCDLAEIKQRFGRRMSLMGNLHTTDVMLRGTVKEVHRESLKAIRAAGEGGGFILSSGDQCGRDTPDENIREMVRVAEEFGHYPLDMPAIEREIRSLS